MSEARIPERYQVLEELGSGGMGSVYKVRDTILDKTFAFKILKGDFARHGIAAQRFQKEAKAAGQLKHKNIIAIIDFGVTTESTPYMVLEYFDGVTLQDWIANNGRLSIDEGMISLSRLTIKGCDGKRDLCVQVQKSSR